MEKITFHANDLTDTHRLGMALAQCLKPGSVVALLGTLGAGKTHLVQALGSGLGLPDGEVVSPTFVLLQEHPGRIPLYHFDAYRLKDEDEFLELGPEEYFEGDGITVVEWADKVRCVLPRDYLTVQIEVTGETTREFEISATGPLYEKIVRQLSEKL